MATRGMEESRGREEFECKQFEGGWKNLKCKQFEGRGKIWVQHPLSMSFSKNFAPSVAYLFLLYQIKSIIFNVNELGSQIDDCKMTVVNVCYVSVEGGGPNFSARTSRGSDF